MSSIPCVNIHCHIHEETSRQLPIVFFGTTHCHRLSFGGKDRQRSFSLINDMIFDNSMISLTTTFIKMNTDGGVCRESESAIR